MMELGALVCTPKKPQCSSCPLQSDCNSKSPDLALSFPVKKAKAKIKPLTVCYVWVLTPKGIPLRQRPSDGRFPSQWEPLVIEADTEKKASQHLEGKLQAPNIQWQPTFIRNFTQYKVTWKEGFLTFPKTNLFKGYEFFQPNELEGLNLVPVMAKTWKLHSPNFFQL
jgi:adenine-specific DNA glycosylase